MPSQPMMTRLKAKTRQIHARMEAHPFVAALVEHRLPLESYVRQLRALAILHASLERELARAQETHVAAIWDEDLRKLDLLLADIAHFHTAGIHDSQPAVEAALALAERIRLQGLEQPIALIGTLYVLEGSTLGNALHGRDVAATFGLDDEGGGCRYYASYPGNVRSHWVGFSERVNRVLAESLDQDLILDAASDTFTGLEALFDALYPIDAVEKVHHITRINPEAGNHPMPQDEAEIAAALRASERTWVAFAYFEARYGARGRRFSDSDACWLAALVDLEPEAMQQQVDWLGSVLANRGMPQIMLERTLHCLHEELVAARPLRAETFGSLKDAAARLCAARTAAIAAPQQAAMASEFERRARKRLAGGSQVLMPRLARFHDTAELLISAVADERNGIQGAVAALRDWLTDPEHDRQDWTEVVDKLIADARQVKGF